MSLNLVEKGFLDFLITAKTHTYASQGDEASVLPILEGSKQLEYKQGDFLYRGIYFGMSFFIGQETVYFQGTPIWSMTYSGGVDKQYDIEFARKVYSFLRQAMRRLTPENPYRGPQNYVEDNFIFNDSNQGTIDQFVGTETILYKNNEVYRLNYSGGFVR